MKVFLAAVGIIVGLIVFSLAGGTVVWVCWDAVHSIFPCISDSIVKDIAWLDAIKLSFICSVLITSTTSSSSK